MYFLQERSYQHPGPASARKRRPAVLIPVNFLYKARGCWGAPAGTAVGGPGAHCWVPLQGSPSLKWAASPLPGSPLFASMPGWWKARKLQCGAPLTEDARPRASGRTEQSLHCHWSQCHFSPAPSCSLTPSPAGGPTSRSPFQSLPQDSVLS